MSVQRTPPSTAPQDDTLQQQSSSRDDDIVPQMDTATNEHTPPSYVFIRNRRPREEELSPSQFLDFKQEMTRLITSFLTEQKKEIGEIKTSLQSLQQSTINIEQNIALLTSQNEEFQKKFEQLEAEVKRDREYIHILEDKVEDLQRTSRKTCIELKNVPRKPSENRDDLIKMVTCLAKNVSLELCERDIKDVFRIKQRNDREKNSPIILELGSTILKSDLLKKVKEFNTKTKNKLQAKHLGHKTSEDTPVYIAEQLTAKGARLYFLSRNLAKTKQYKYCWTAFGKVYVRKDDQSRIIHIQSEAQVHQLLQEI